MNNITGYSLLISDLKNLENDISTFLNVKHKNKPYIKLINNLEASLILSLVLGKSLSFGLKYQNFDLQPINKLFHSIGMDLIRIINMENYKEFLKNDVKDDLYDVYTPSSFIEFFEKHGKSVDEDTAIKIGFEFTYIISENSNFFELKESKIDRNLTKRYIILKSGFKDIINTITLTTTSELPMIIKPLPIVINNEGKLIQFGGSLSNNKYKMSTLRSHSYENISANDMTYTNNVINAINFVNSVEYTINKELYYIITHNNFIKNNENLIYFTPHHQTGEINKLLKDKKHHEVSYIYKYNSKYISDVSILNIAKLMLNVEKFHLSMFIDWRGRFYSSRCSLNFKGGELARSLLFFKKGKVLSEEGLRSL